MYTSVNPSLIIEKCGLRGSKLYRYVFVSAFGREIILTVTLFYSKGDNLRFYNNLQCIQEMLNIFFILK